jgi:hypothetical protein
MLPFLQKSDIPVSALIDVVGYKPNYIVQRFVVLGEDKSAAVLQHFELNSSVFFPPMLEAECGICDETFPVDFLMAAHIKMRSRCSFEQGETCNGRA